MIANRLKSAAFASLLHFLGSVLVAGACAGLVFGLWYPYPFSELIGGRELFLLVVTVDVVCGPLLTLVVFDTRKPRRELVRDLTFVVLIQLAALAYGLATVTQARPVFVAFEGARFRVVKSVDIDHAKLGDAPVGMQRLSWFGPELIGVQLAKPSDRDFPQSVQLAMQGEHPAFRPVRWRPYGEMKDAVRAALQPVAELRRKHLDRAQDLSAEIAKTGLSEAQLGYLPLEAGKLSDWVVLVGRADAEPKAYIPFDGW